MEINLNITKKYFWVLISLILISTSIILVRSFGTNNPQAFGHSAGEIEVNINGNPVTLQQAFNQLLSNISTPVIPQTGVNYTACNWTGWDVTSVSQSTAGPSPVQVCSFNVVTCPTDQVVVKVEAKKIQQGQTVGCLLFLSDPENSKVYVQRRYQCCKLF